MKSETENLLDERHKTHGLWSDFAWVARGMKEIVVLYQRRSGKTLSNEHQESIDMILHKVARIVTGDANVKDHWDDTAGYAVLGSKAVKDDRTIKTPPEGQEEAAAKKSCSEGPTYPKVLATGFGQTLLLSPPFKGDVV